jgi:hypothetical protein
VPRTLPRRQHLRFPSEARAVEAIEEPDEGNGRAGELGEVHPSGDVIATTSVNRDRGTFEGCDRLRELDQEGRAEAVGQQRVVMGGGLEEEGPGRAEEDAVGAAGGRRDELAGEMGVIHRRDRADMDQVPHPHSQCSPHPSAIPCCGTFPNRAQSLLREHFIHSADQRGQPRDHHLMARVGGRVGAFEREHLPCH